MGLLMGAKMNWIHHFQLFLFDFDGLLVNTEHLQCQAYINILEKRGYHLDWTLPQFFSLAHTNSNAVKEALYAKFPDLDPNWPMIHEEKQQMFLELVASGKVEMMPGAEKLLRNLEKSAIQRAVVTNSSMGLIQAIRSQHSLLQTIPHWFTREDYLEPKPNPECYLLAIQRLGKTGDRIIGFEDTLRGLRALQQSPAVPVLISSTHNSSVDIGVERSLHFTSFDAIGEDWMSR